MTTVCPPRHDICLTRGNPYSLDTLLVGGAFEDVAENPESFRSRMVIREQNKDWSPELLVLEGSFEASDDSCPPGVSLQFAATPTQTQALPGYGLTYFVELTDANLVPIDRLFEGKVKVKD